MNPSELIWPHFAHVLQGFRVVPARHCWHKSLVPLIAEIRQQMCDGPVYLSFDIDALDPCYAPATGLSYSELTELSSSIYPCALFPYGDVYSGIGIRNPHYEEP